MRTLVTHIAQLVTPQGRGAVFGARMGDLKAFENVEILIVDGRIASIDREGQHPVPDATINAKGRVVLPGLVDPHRHVGAACLPDGGCERSRSAKNRRGSVPLERRLLRSARRALAGGTTTVGIKCGADRSSADEVDLLAAVRATADATPLRTCPALLGTPRGTERRGRDDRISETIGEAIPASLKRRRTIDRAGSPAIGVSAFTAPPMRVPRPAARMIASIIAASSSPQDVRH